MGVSAGSVTGVSCLRLGGSIVHTPVLSATLLYVLDKLTRAVFNATKLAIMERIGADGLK